MSVARYSEAAPFPSGVFSRVKVSISDGTGSMGENEET